MRCALLSLISRFSLLAILLACPAKAADPVLAPSGTLRAVYIGSNVAQARRDPATGTITGASADVARELGRRADVPVSIAPLPTAAAVLEAVRSGQADIGFVAPNPERMGVCCTRRLTCWCSRARSCAPILRSGRWRSSTAPVSDRDQHR